MPSDNDEKGRALININISDVFGLSKAAEHFVRALERGVGNALEPGHRRRFASAEITNFESWMGALDRTGLAPKAAELSLSERALVRLVAESTRQQENREGVAFAAAGEFKREAGGPQLSVPMDDEWVDRFWRLAQDVTNADMQAVWGRILARQSSGRSRFSPRSLEAISLLTRDEIRLLERLATLLWHGRGQGKPCHFILLGVHLRGKKQLDQNLRRRIVEIVGDLHREIVGPAGIALDSGSGWAQESELDFVKETSQITIGTKKFTLRIPGADGPTHLGGALGISPLGGEIFSLISTTPDVDYVDVMSEAFRSQGADLTADPR
jgi:hypothetical protein